MYKLLPVYMYMYTLVKKLGAEAQWLCKSTALFQNQSTLSQSKWLERSFILRQQKFLDFQKREKRLADLPNRDDNNAHVYIFVRRVVLVEYPHNFTRLLVHIGIKNNSERNTEKR